MKTDPAVTVALGHAPAAARPALAALFALDHRLGEIARTARDPMIGQLRLRWWEEALVALDRGAPPAEPILQALAATALPRGVDGATLAGMVTGWEALLGGEVNPDDATLAVFARERGGALFVAAASMLDATDDYVTTAGEGWALASLIRSVTDQTIAQQVTELAKQKFDVAFASRWSRALRSLGILALMAQFDLIAHDKPLRHFARLSRFRLTGR